MRSLLMKTSAVISDCGKYRYLLTRQWDESLPMMVWIMLNPSTADAEKDDPTIRRCIGYACNWGYGGFKVVNLFAYRAPWPNALHGVDDPVGPDNRRHIFEAVDGAKLVVAAWGTGGTYRNREQQVLEQLQTVSVKLHCLEVTKYGRPRHPLYCPSDLTPVPFKGKV